MMCLLKPTRLILGTLLLLLGLAARAASVDVPAQFPQLQLAIDDASVTSGSTIRIVTPGTYNGFMLGGKQLTIANASGGEVRLGAVVLRPGAPVGLTMTGLTITAVGVPAGADGICCLATSAATSLSLTLDHCVIAHCAGRGLALDGPVKGRVSLTATVVEANGADAIQVTPAGPGDISLRMDYCTIRGLIISSDRALLNLAATGSAHLAFTAAASSFFQPRAVTPVLGLQGAVDADLANCALSGGLSGIKGSVLPNTRVALTHCTVSGAGVRYGSGRAALWDQAGPGGDGARWTVTNCILDGFDVALRADSDGGKLATTWTDQHNLYHVLRPGQDETLSGNRFGYPRFALPPAAPGMGDFHLAPFSPAKGLGLASVGVDLDGGPRPVPAGSAPDAGAFEAPADSSNNWERFQAWGEEALDLIERDFRIPDTDYYYEDETRQGYAYTWGCSIQIWALAAAVMVEPEQYRSRLDKFIQAMNIYWDPKTHQIGGYDCAPLPGTTNRFYDDNGWMAVGLLEAYKVTQNPQYLQRARDTVKFVFSGEDATFGGGLWWKETWYVNDPPRMKATCSTAGAALSALMLYEATGEAQYREDGERVLDWLAAKMQDQDGLFWNDMQLDGSIGTVKWSYNSAIPLRCYTLLYALTKERQYLDRAERIAAAAEKYWVAPATGTVNDDSQFAFTLIDGYLRLYEQDHNQHWLDVAGRALDFVHNKNRDPYGRYPKGWNATPAAPLTTWSILYPPSNACAFFRAAQYNRDWSGAKVWRRYE